MNKACLLYSSPVRNVHTFSRMISVTVEKKSIGPFFLNFGEIFQQTCHIYLFLINFSRVSLCVSQPQYTVLHGLSLPGVICSVQGGGSGDLRGERSRGRSILKNTARPKGQTSG